MAAVLKIYDPQPAEVPTRLLNEVHSLPTQELAALLCHIASRAMLSVPPSVSISADPVFSFARAILSFCEPSLVNRPRANSRSGQIASQILRLRSGVTGPERALAAAVKLYHSGEPEVSARSINFCNDDAKGAFISNISTAIASNLRSGLISEIEKDGHSNYEVTIQGFAAFDLLHSKLNEQLTSAGQSGDSESAA